MKSRADTVDAYLSTLTEDRREALTRLRALCRKILRGHIESMDWGMPCYKVGDEASIAFASQKATISLYVLREEIVERNASLLKGLSVGKSCIRFPRPEKMDFGVIERLLADTAESFSAKTPAATSGAKKAAGKKVKPA